MTETVPRRTLGRYRPYAKYKESGVELLGSVPAHWRAHRLKGSSRLVARRTTATRLEGCCPSRATAESSQHTENDPAGPDMYHAEIFRKLGDVPLKTIAKATGLSMSTCSLIQQGKQIPHPRHWEALGRIGSYTEPTTSGVQGDTRPAPIGAGRCCSTT